MNNSPLIYLDHAATTPCDIKVVEHMMPYFTEHFGNASSIHSSGGRAKLALDEARGIMAGVLNCRENEIIFTSGGTESDNLAIRGVCESAGKGHIITSAIEHHAVLHSVEDMEKRGFSATYIPVDKYGVVNPEDVKRAVKKNTILVSVMMANNEIGTIEPIAEIGKILKIINHKRQNTVYFHTDAVQAAGSLKIDVKKLNVDLLSISSHKFYGPKGAGVLYVKEGTALKPQQLGGGQERKRRASTENVPGICGMAKALELTAKKMEEESKRLCSLRDYFIKKLIKEIPDIYLNGHPKKRLPNNIHIAVSRVEGESMLLRLDLAGVQASSGSACTSGTLDPSHVLLAIGLSHELAQGGLRFTLGKSTRKKDLDYTVKMLKKIVKDLRKMSPL